MKTTYTLRYRSSDDWEQQITEEHDTFQSALEVAYHMLIGDFGITFGDFSINGEAYNSDSVIEELQRIEYYKEQ